MYVHELLLVFFVIIVSNLNAVTDESIVALLYR
jgi:hypothetical protein